jgi:anti-sigma B factor antagonist
VSDASASSETTTDLDLRTDGRVPSRESRLIAEVLDHRGIVLLRLSGELTSTEATAVRTAIDAVLEAPARNLQLGLAGVSFMDSGGAQALLRVRDRVSAAGVPLQLLGPSRPVRRVLDVTGLAGVFDIIE